MRKRLFKIQLHLYLCIYCLFYELALLTLLRKRELDSCLFFDASRRSETFHWSVAF